MHPGHRPCLGDGTGFVRARIRGALNLDLNWKDAELECGGAARPDGSGLRVSFAGPGPGGKVLRLVFGVRSAHEGAAGKELPTNLTVLVDGGRVFATRGDDKCTMDQLSQHACPDSDAGLAHRGPRLLRGTCQCAGRQGPHRGQPFRFRRPHRVLRSESASMNNPTRWLLSLPGRTAARLHPAPALTAVRPAAPLEELSAFPQTTLTVSGSGGTPFTIWVADTPPVRNKA